MRNDEFLVFTYFVAGLICLCFAWAAYLYLRRPFEEIVDAMRQKNWSQALKRAFPASIFLLAFSGFLFVDRGCGAPDYAKIVTSRSEILSVNQGHIAQGASSIVVALFLWLLGVLFFFAIGRSASEAEDRGET